MRLRVHIDQEDSLARPGKSTGQVYRYCCFTATTFLIDYRYRSHNFSPTPGFPFAIQYRKGFSLNRSSQNPFLLLKTAFQHCKTTIDLSNYSAKKYEKLYLFMGPANKNITTHTNIRYFSALGNKQEGEKGVPNTHSSNNL
jgi:hypothetical protein